MSMTYTPANHMMMAQQHLPPPNDSTVPAPPPLSRSYLPPYEHVHALLFILEDLLRHLQLMCGGLCGAWVGGWAASHKYATVCVCVGGGG